MKISALAAMLFLTGAAQASAVTIDFENNPSYLTDGVTGTVLMDGYRVSGGGWSPLDGPEPAYLFNGFNGTKVFGTSIDPQICNSGGCGFINISLRREDGGAFGFYGFDFDAGGGFSVSGSVAGGGNISGGAYGTGDWLNVVSVSFGVDLGSGAFTPGGYIELDNLQVNTVPVPAAVWLFVSALMGLGWFRRN